MELMPPLQFGLLNGWVFLGFLALTDGVLFSLFPREVVSRLFDRSGWSQKQISFTVLGKLFALVCIFLLIFTPLKLGSPVFYTGAGLAVLGLFGLAKALFDFRNTPLRQPVTRGIYRISRHPQIVMSSLVILGACIAVGSWTAVFVFTAARLFSHLGIVAEEEKCLQQYDEAYRDYLKSAPRYFLFF